MNERPTSHGPQINYQRPMPNPRFTGPPPGYGPAGPHQGGPWGPAGGPPPRPPMPGERRPYPPDGRQPGRPGPPMPPPPWSPPQGSHRPLPPAPDAPAPAPARPRRRRQWIASSVAVVVLGGLGALGWYAGHSAPAAAAVGDCVTQTGADDVSIVGCGEPAAQFRVVGRLENRTMIDAGLFACSDFPDATSSYWQGELGEPGLVLCLAPVA